MITIRNLSKSFGSRSILENLNAEIAKGEVIAIIGPSGTGKSVFLRCLDLLEKPDSGEIIVDGQNILAPDADVCAVRQKMGMVFQSFNLFSHLMVIENIILAPMQLLGKSKLEAYQEAMQLLEMVNLAEKAYAYPDELSGGQKQRVAIARTLAMHPEIILFDEPTSALDPTMVSEVLAVIRRLAREGMTMMIVTHEMKFAQDVASRIFYMDEKGIYEDGTPEQIFEHPEKPKTRAFIHKIRSFNFEIRSRQFDLYALQGQLEQFCRKQMIDTRQIQNMLLLVEEMTHGMILSNWKEGMAVDLDINVEYSEKTGDVVMNALYPLESTLPQDEEDNLSMMIIERYAREVLTEKLEDRMCLRVIL